ncbi:hypothetical protein GALMADRAFT_53516 [Galerina marginata CBS 339.88]|uniref:Uncharacterized protein n=1 Tax=Galerina marginata (strain CBS 339.88) TaxID=685588 RepID=A0A067U154_GALM3|nr:hypothetical protein GALMADRAFT_53516 [Galerina marginata CBS 339.88]
MPTCTLPFEILLEFFNDMAEPTTLQLTQARDDNLTTGATILLQPEDSISLVLNAGSTYHYLFKQHIRKAHIS